MNRIGLIAGGGQFPVLFARAARTKGFEVWATALIGETDPALADEVARIQWVRLGQIGKMIRFFSQNTVSEAVMLGSVTKTKLFADVRPDLKAIALMARLRHTHDDGLLSAVAWQMEKEGIRIQPSTLLLPELLAPPGCWTRRRPNPAEMADMNLGWGVAKQIGHMDIGQCVVVGGGSVLAVEAIDGTDATILRGGTLGKGNAVVVKVCKPNQDLRFDMPAVGVQTIATMAACGATALMVEARKAVVFDRAEMVRLADERSISIVARLDGNTQTVGSFQ
jgi:hypothetical protein